MDKLTPKKAKKVISNIRREIKDYFQKNNLKYAIFGKSKGLDSSVVAGILSDIPGIKPIGVIMPCESDNDDERIAKIVLNHFKISIIKIDLTISYRSIKDSFYQNEPLNNQILKAVEESEAETLKKRFEKKEKYALGNIKARLRMITLYHLAQLTGGIVIGAGNYSERLLGFWTLHGDTGDLAPIGQIFKGTELYEIGKALGVPKESLEAIPADGLGISQYDEDQLGLPYPEIDKILILLLKENLDPASISKATNIPQKKVTKVIQRFRENAFKRKVPILITRKKIGLTD